MALVNLSIYCTWKNIKSTYKNNKFKTSASTWNGEFDLPDGSYSVYVNRITYKIVLKLKTSYELQLLSRKTWSF